MPNIDLSILNQRQTPAFYADVFANRPAAGYVGRIFVSTDTFAFYRDNGTGWDLIGGPGTGTITGSGTTNTVAKFTGSAILGNSSITDNGTEVSMKLLKLDTTSFGSSTINFGQASSLNAVGTGYSALGAIGTTGMMFYIPQATTNRSFIFDISSIPDATTRTYNVPSSSGTLALTSNIPSVSGAAGQVSYFNGTNSITGSNDLFWDSVNGHLGVNTNVPGTALDVHHDQPTVAILNQTVATNDVRIGFQNNGVGLWRIGAFYNAGANDFGIFDAVGNIQPVTVKKTSGQVLIGTSTVGSGKLVVASASSDNGIQIVGASAPSLRIDSAESGPTKRAGLGISTATNNFIQGSADRDFCMFNGSTTASPILFGVYDAGAANVQEAARISAARNFLIGTTTDAGYKLQISGTALITGAATFNNIVTASGYFYANSTSPNSSGFIPQLSGTTKGWFATAGTTGDLLYEAATGDIIVRSQLGKILLGTYQTGAPDAYTALCIANNRNVGIGTTTPATTLEVLGVNEGEYFRGGGGTISGRSLTFSSFTVSGTVGVGHRISAPNASANLIFSVAGSDRLSISNTGAATFSSSVTTNGGGFIGNMSTTQTPALLIDRSSTGYNGIIKFTTAGVDKWILGNRNTSDETFKLYNYNVAADVITVTNSGNLLILTSVDSGEQLQVNGSAKFSGIIRQGAGIYLATGQFSATGSTTTVMYTFPNSATNQAYLVTVRQAGGGNNTVVGMVFMYALGSVGYNIAQDNTNPALFLTISTSGTSIQLTTGAGYGTTTWEYTITILKN